MILLSFIIWVLLGLPIACMPMIYAKLGVNEGVAEYAIRYTRYTYPFLFFDLLCLAYLTYAGAQKVVSYSVYSVLPAMLTQGLLLKLLFSKYDFNAILMANGAMFIVRFLFAWGLVTKSGRFQKFDDVRFFSKETITNIGPMVKIGCQGVAMGVWSWYTYDMFGLMASRMGDQEVAAAAVMRIVAMSSIMIPAGLMSACGIYVGISVGAGQARAATQYYYAALV